jgi:hypothetical protein
MVAFHDWAIELAYQLDAFARICVVADDVAQTDEISTPALTRVGYYGFKRFEIGMNVTENGESHFDSR